jgi:DNA-binding IclR family transcriptional regulator
MTVYLDRAPAPKDEEIALSSIAKAVRVLRALALAGDDADGVTHIAHLTNLPKSTTHRLLAELIDLGLVSRSDLRYRLGTGWFELQAALSCSEWVRLADRAKQPLAALFERTNATVHFGVLDDDHVLYLEKLTAKGGTRVPTRVGGRMPALCTALGKSIVAFSESAVLRAILSGPLPHVSRRSITSPRLIVRQLQQIRQTGVAYDLEESQSGVFCVAAPVFREGKVCAAVSVTRVGSPGAGRTDEADVRRAAQEIAAWIDPDN